MVVKLLATSLRVSFVCYNMGTKRENPKTEKTDMFNIGNTAKKTLAATAVCGLVLFCASADPVAEIGGVGYESLSEAFADVREGQTIRLVSDIDGSVDVVVPSSAMTLDLNGYSLEAIVLYTASFEDEASCAIVNGELGSGYSGYFALSVEGKVNVSLDNVHVAGIICSLSDGAVTIRGGTYELNGYEDIPFWCRSWAEYDGSVCRTLYIEGGEFSYDPRAYGRFVNDEFAVTENDGVWTVSRDEEYRLLDGSGTAEDPFLVCNADDLMRFVRSVNCGNMVYNGYGIVVALEADIDLAGVEFPGIGNFDYAYMGSFDGRGHEIRNLSLTQEWDGCAGFIDVLIGSLSNVSFVNADLELIPEDIPEEYCDVGIAVGYADFATIGNVRASGLVTVAGGAFSGALVGTALDTEIDDDCGSSVYVYGDSQCPIIGEPGYGDFELPDPVECRVRTFALLVEQDSEFENVNYESFSRWIEGNAAIGEELTLEEFLATPNLFAAYAFDLPYDTFAGVDPQIRIDGFEKHTKNDGNWATLVFHVAAGQRKIPVSCINASVVVRYGSTPANLSESVELSKKPNYIAYGTEGDVMVFVPPPAGDPQNVFFAISLK